MIFEQAYRGRAPPSGVFEDLADNFVPTET